MALAGRHGKDGNALLDFVQKVHVFDGGIKKARERGVGGLNLSQER